MRIYSKYVASLAVAVCLVSALLAFVGQEDMAVCFTANLAMYLLVTLLHVYLNPRARKALSTVGTVFSTGFLVIMVPEVVETLSG